MLCAGARMRTYTCMYTCVSLLLSYPHLSLFEHINVLSFMHTLSLLFRQSSSFSLSFFHLPTAVYVPRHRSSCSRCHKLSFVGTYKQWNVERFICESKYETCPPVCEIRAHLSHSFSFFNDVEDIDSFVYPRRWVLCTLLTECTAFSFVYISHRMYSVHSE